MNIELKRESKWIREWEFEQRRVQVPKTLSFEYEPTREEFLKDWNIIDHRSEVELAYCGIPRDAEADAILTGLAQVDVIAAEELRKARLESQLDPGADFIMELMLFRRDHPLVNPVSFSNDWFFVLWDDVGPHFIAGPRKVSNSQDIEYAHAAQAAIRPPLQIAFDLFQSIQFPPHNEYLSRAYPNLLPDWA